MRVATLTATAFAAMLAFANMAQAQITTQAGSSAASLANVSGVSGGTGGNANSTVNTSNQLQNGGNQFVYHPVDNSRYQGAANAPAMVLGGNTSFNQCSGESTAVGVGVGTSAVAPTIGFQHAGIDHECRTMRSAVALENMAINLNLPRLRYTAASTGCSSSALIQVTCELNGVYGGQVAYFAQWCNSHNTNDSSNEVLACVRRAVASLQQNSPPVAVAAPRATVRQGPCNTCRDVYATTSNVGLPQQATVVGEPVGADSWRGTASPAELARYNRQQQRR